VTTTAHDSLVLLALLVAGTALLVLAPLLRIPYPILLVLGGLGISFVPGAPHLQLQPEVVLVGFLPPLLYSGAFFTSLRDLRTNARAISLLAVGLVLATMLTVAAVCHSVICRGGSAWCAARSSRRPTPLPPRRSARGSGCRAGS
jgi:CPA1 family monovalent cation:H+ antiporter